MPGTEVSRARRPSRKTGWSSTMRTRSASSSRSSFSRTHARPEADRSCARGGARSLLASLAETHGPRACPRPHPKVATFDAAMAPRASSHCAPRGVPPSWAQCPGRSGNRSGVRKRCRGGPIGSEAASGAARGPGCRRLQDRSRCRRRPAPRPAPPSSGSPRPGGRRLRNRCRHR